MTPNKVTISGTNAAFERFHEQSLLGYIFVVHPSKQYSPFVKSFLFLSKTKISIVREDVSNTSPVPRRLLGRRSSTQGVRGAPVPTRCCIAGCTAQLDHQQRPGGAVALSCYVGDLAMPEWGDDGERPKLTDRCVLSPALSAPSVGRYAHAEARFYNHPTESHDGPPN